MSGRRLEPLTLDSLPDLPTPCRRCVFWELSPVAAQQAERAGDTEFEKEAWLSAALLEWGSVGRIAYVDDVPAGYLTYAPRTWCRGRWPSPPRRSAVTPCCS